MKLTRIPLLLERARPSVTDKPKARTRKISTRRMLGSTRRSLYARIARRTRDRATPQFREVMRGLSKIRYDRSKIEKPKVDTGPRQKLITRSDMMKGIRL